MRFSLYLEQKDNYLTLYRGDSKNYKVHSLAKGDIYALFGQGIYLTTNKRVAGDYTSKGSNDILFRFSGSPGKTTKDMVIKAYISNLARHIDENGKETFWMTSLPGFVNDPVRVKRLEHARRAWERVMDNYEVRVNLDGEAVIKRKGSGYISEYRVPMEIINRTLHADNAIDGKIMGVIERAIGHRVRVDDEDEITFRGIYDRLRDEMSEERVQVALRRGLKELGYSGIEYSGGITMGGGIRHRAFVFWDEQGIGAYKVI